MSVGELKKMLDNYNDDAEVVVVDWSNGKEYSFSVGSDDEDEGTRFCRIGI